MKLNKLAGTLALLFAFGTLYGCSNTQQKSPDVTNQIRSSLDQAGLKDVSVSQDRDKGVVTLKGSANSDADKAQAESIAKSVASSQVISNEISVRPNGEESTAKTMDKDTDKGIEKNLDAALAKNRTLKKEVRYDVKNGVITLKGKVATPSQRSEAERVASGVPNVKQVVNELQVRNEKASSKKAASD